MTTGLFFQCVCLVYQWQCQFAAAAGDDDDDDDKVANDAVTCLLYTSPSPRDRTRSRMPSSA